MASIKFEKIGQDRFHEATGVRVSRTQPHLSLYTVSAPGAEDETHGSYRLAMAAAGELVAAKQAERKYRITYRKNTLAKGWVTKHVEFVGTAERAEKIAAGLIANVSYVLLSSEVIG